MSLENHTPRPSKPRKYEVIVRECFKCAYCKRLEGYDGGPYFCEHPKHPLQREDLMILCTSIYGDIRDDCPLEFADEEEKE